ncbi:hypothetical protein ARAM_005590 [Aspergillus rambellii]|uniref:Phospholipid/glycerol acyltransferase domain-containing protein n=1 Tax=Aspergillus rambellii TaxID=308745 RepID=A0A0F8UA07_9EURO|nr:hypothetical protein ARAM_005590 [Aspergillus rambellii]
MEKFSQFRDRGSGIAPFLPMPSQPVGFQLPLRVFLFCFRLPLFVFACACYFLILQWLPIGALGKKASLWCILGIPSIWWIDLQVDGVRKGSLSKHHHQARLPGPNSIIASSFTSPIDPLYLAAIFDPIFTASYPSTRQVAPLSLLQAILRCFAPPQLHPPQDTPLYDLAALARKYPGRPIVAFAECTTTNGRAILPLSPALLGASPAAKIFPVSLRYTPVDVVTPVPASYVSFLWTLLSAPTHCIRVRIAEPVAGAGAGAGAGSADGDGAELTASEQALLDTVGDSLARLGRVKRVGLGVREKLDFVRMWTRTRRTW